MNAPTNTFRIENVNGVHELTVDLSEPGVHVARGRNGAGKTSTLHAIVAASGGDAPVVPTDGMERGKIEGPGGVVLAVGRTRRYGGDPVVELLETGPIATLIDPGLKDTAAAARARVKALLDLVRPAVTEETVRRLSGGRDLGVPAGSGTLMDIANRIKAEAEAEARKAEERLATLRGQATAAREALGGAEPEAPVVPVEEARRLAQEARTRAVHLGLAARARRDLEARQEEIRGSLGERPDTASAEARVQDLTGEVNRVLVRIANLQEQLENLRREEATAAAELRIVQQAAKRWDEGHAVLAKPAEGPTAEELAAAEAQAEQAERAVEAATLGAQRAAMRAKAAAAEEQIKREVREASALRGIAGAIPTVLAELLRESGVPGLTVRDGRLLAEIAPGEWVDFEARLSFGQRVRAALTVALHAARRQGVRGVPILPLDPAHWAALDPERKVEVHTLAREVGICLVTEEPTDGELRVESLEELIQRDVIGEPIAEPEREPGEET